MAEPLYRVLNLTFNADPVIYSITVDSLIDLSNKICVVTGGSKGIGLAIASLLAQASAHVIIADVDSTGAQQAAADLNAKGALVSALEMDVSNEDSILRFSQNLLEQFGSPWALINNAGLQDRQHFLDTSAQEWDRLHGVNARGPFLLTREFARMMITNAQGGRVVNLASMVLQGGIVQGLVAYGASKGALLGLSQTTAYELAEHGITVNTVLPGGVATPGAIAAKGPPACGPGSRNVPLGRCEPKDIASAVLYFVSPMARRVTNQVLAVDGGFSVS